MYKLIAPVLLALLLASSAQADPITLSLTGTGSNSYGGYAVYPYYFTVGSTTGVPLLCDDFGNVISTGDSWSAAVNTFSTLSGTLFASKFSDYTTRYEEAGWLFLQLGPNPSASKAAAINWAIWGLFDTALVCTNGNCTGDALSYYNSGAATWAADALAAITATGSGALPANYFSNLVIYTPPTGSKAQEMIGGGPVPEPSTVLLIGSGLVIVGGYMRRVRHSRSVVRQ